MPHHRSTHGAVRAPGRLLLLGVVTCLACRGPSLDAPPPDLAEDTDAPPTLPASILNVPITYDLSPLLRKVDSIVPQRMGNLEERRTLPSNHRIEYSFDARRDRFRADLNGDTARLSAIVHYRGRGWYDPPIGPTVSASCGDGANESPRRAVLALTAPITIDENWMLRAHSRVSRVSPLSQDDRDQCKITFMRYDITNRLMDAVAGVLRGHTDDIDRIVAGVDVRSKFEEFWQLLQTPIELSDSIWLVIDPFSVRKGAVQGDSLVITANVALTAAPRIIVGPRPEIAYKPLPALDSGSVAEGLTVLVEGVIDYRLASDFLEEQLVGRTFEGARQKIEITNARMFGIGGGRLALEVGFRGATRGRLYFVGAPQIDPESRLVIIPDLDIELASWDLVVKGLTWLGRPTIVDFLRERARFPVEDPIQLGRRYLHEGLNRSLSDEVHLTGEVIDVQPLGVHATRRALIVRAQASALAHLTIQRPNE